MYKGLLQLFIAFFLLNCFQILAFSQQSSKTAPSASCEPERALSLVIEQLNENSALDPKSRRVELYCQAADLLWKHRQDNARTVFRSAYDWASELVAEKKETARKAKNDSDSDFTRSDLRLEVIRKIAKHDPKWAQQLTDNLLAEMEDPEEKGGSRSHDDLLPNAEQLVSLDEATAIKLANRGLASASGEDIASFLAALAKRDSKAADAFFLDALAVTSKRSINDTLTLYTYPFAAVRPIGPGWQSVGVWGAKDLQPNPMLQVRYIETLLQLAAYYSEQPIVTTAPRDGPYSLSPAARLYLGLGDLEPIVSAKFPQLYAKLLQAKQKIAGVITDEFLKIVQSIIQSRQTEAEKPFDSALEVAEREKSPGSKDRRYFEAIRQGINKEPEDKLVGLWEKIFDAETRRQAGDWLYFSLAQRSIAEGRMDDASRLAEKIGPLDLRAYLYFQIAEGALAKSKDYQRARASLDAAWRNANEADDTNEKAKALLGVASLYLQIEPAQALLALQAAVKTINHVAKPDVASDKFIKIVKGPNFSTHTVYAMPGMSFNHAFREMGKSDYEAAVSTAFGLEDKFLRANAIFSLSAFCLEKAPLMGRPTGKKADK